MKRVITALTIKQAHAAGKTQLYAPVKETIVTPEARSLAKDLGVCLIEFEGNAREKSAPSIPLDESVVKQIVDKVINSLPPSKRDYTKVKSVVVNVLSEYLENKH